MVRLILTRIEVRRLTVQVGTLISYVAGRPVQTPPSSPPQSKEKQQGWS